MASDRRREANRQNGRKSRGPKTLAGKAISSRNSLQHGLNLVNRNNPKYAPDIEAYADELCGGYADDDLREYALAIAEAQAILTAVRDHVTLTIDRFRDPTVLSYRKGMKTMTRRLTLTLKRCKIYDKIEAAYAKPSGKRSQPDTANVQELLNEFWAPLPRSDAEAACEAAPDMLRLSRYSRRAWSQRRRFVRDFVRRKKELERDAR